MIRIVHCVYSDGVTPLDAEYLLQLKRTIQNEFISAQVDVKVELKPEKCDTWIETDENIDTESMIQRVYDIDTQVYREYHFATA